jgi:hypothetical protein
MWKQSAEEKCSMYECACTSFEMGECQNAVPAVAVKSEKQKQQAEQYCVPLHNTVVWYTILFSLLFLFLTLYS